MTRAAMAEVARLYYVRELTQQQIADRLGVSRFKVLRLLEQARAEGVVRFEIDEPVPVRRRALTRARGALRHRTAVVVERDVAARRRIAAPPPRCGRSDVLGVAWGETLAAIVEQPAARRAAAFPVVQICGAIEGVVPGTGPTEVAARFAAWTGGRLPSARGARGRRRAARCGGPSVRRRRSSTTSRWSLVGIGARPRRRRAHARARLRRRRPDRLGRTGDRAVGAPAAPRDASSPRRAAARSDGPCSGALQDGPRRRARHRRRLREARAAMSVAVVTGARGGIGIGDRRSIRGRRLHRARSRPRRRVSRPRTDRRARLRARHQRPQPR